MANNSARAYTRNNHFLLIKIRVEKSSLLKMDLDMDFFLMMQVRGYLSLRVTSMSMWLILLLFLCCDRQSQISSC